MPCRRDHSGGVYPTTLPEEAGKDPNVDWLFMYHAEERLLAFLDLLASRKLDAARAFPGLPTVARMGPWWRTPHPSSSAT